MFELFIDIILAILVFAIFSFIMSCLENLIHMLDIKKDHTHDNDEDWGMTWSTRLI